MFRSTILLLILLILSGCSSKVNISEAINSLDSVERAVNKNEAVNKRDLNIMKSVWDYYHDNKNFSDKEKDVYAKYLAVYRDVQIYNEEIEREDSIASDITKERILEGISNME